MKNNVKSEILRNIKIRDNTVSMEGDAIRSIQIDELCEVAELRWDGANELIPVEVPERATMTQ